MHNVHPPNTIHNQDIKYTEYSDSLQTGLRRTDQGARSRYVGCQNNPTMQIKYCAFGVYLYIVTRCIGTILTTYKPGLCRKGQGARFRYVGWKNHPTIQLNGNEMYRTHSTRLQIWVALQTSRNTPQVCTDEVGNVKSKYGTRIYAIFQQPTYLEHRRFWAQIYSQFVPIAVTPWLPDPQPPPSNMKGISTVSSITLRFIVVWCCCCRLSEGCSYI